MKAVITYHVPVEIPPPLAGLNRLAANLHWTWDDATRDVFRRIDPSEWDADGHDPMRLLASVSPARWVTLANDPDLVAAVHERERALGHALNDPRWFQERTASPLKLVAYFSPEFGISETLPQYSGGLGVLAGDHLKASSDLGIPLVGIGLLYRNGYFRQDLDAAGWQTERFPPFDPEAAGLTDTGLRVHVDLAGEQVTVKIWRADVGRTPLYLLDTAVDENSPGGFDVTDRLYGGDVEHRLRQEIVLGIGGVRALRTLGLDPDIFHTNEGHAGFLALERVRELVAAGTAFPTAVEATRAGNLFTTHTPVPAGIDRFPPALMHKYFGSFATGLGIPLDALQALGHRDDEPAEPRFNMAVLGLRLSAQANGVAALHGAVSRRMFQGVWPAVPTDEIPITSVTNGVHALTWVAPRIAHLFARAINPIWDGASDEMWAGAENIDDVELWTLRHEGRAELVEAVRTRVGATVLDADALTIGFARRFATYKRATLLLSQPDRLRKLLSSSDRPVQFVFAGKAHPADEPGKQMIQAIHNYSRDLGISSRFVFVPDYDIGIARSLYHGADVWLNNPRRPLEACGTSGMKAALNGALNCSIRDGWWDEWYHPSNGWAIPTTDDPDLARRDEREASALFEILETGVIPAFYTRDDRGIPVSWLDRIRFGWSYLGPKVTAARMVKEYTTRLYEPAATRAAVMMDGDGAAAASLSRWKLTVAREWHAVHVGALQHEDPDPTGGRRVTVDVTLGSLSPDDVTVELVHGPLDDSGSITSPTVVAMDPPGASGSSWSRVYRPGRTGRYGATVRVRPSHPALASPMETGLLKFPEDAA